MHCGNFAWLKIVTWEITANHNTAFNKWTVQKQKNKSTKLFTLSGGGGGGEGNTLLTLRLSQLFLSNPPRRRLIVFTSSVYCTGVCVCVFVCVLYFFSFLCIFCPSAIQNYLLAFSLLHSLCFQLYLPLYRSRPGKNFSSLVSHAGFFIILLSTAKKMNTLNDLNLKCLSLNVRGLTQQNFYSKHRLIFRWLHKQKQHSYFCKSEWGDRVIYSHGTNHSKGVMILINPSVDCKIEKNYLWQKWQVHYHKTLPWRTIYCSRERLRSKWPNPAITCRFLCKAWSVITRILSR